nr:uncharacterized protein LOC128700868 isoform X1 [Cherax quadricarinatus]
MASAQSVRGTTIVHRRPSATTVQEPVGAAAFSAGPSVSSAPARASASSAGAPAVATAAGTPGATGGLVAGQQSLGPAFYGPGLNNPLAVPLNPLVAQQAQRIAAANPNIRVFVDVDGSAHFTDQFGREVEEIIDEFGRDVSEVLDVQEQQERLLRAREQELKRRRQLLELELLQDFNTNPTAFNPTSGIAGGVGGGVGSTAGGLPLVRIRV